MQELQEEIERLKHEIEEIKDTSKKRYAVLLAITYILKDKEDDIFKIRDIALEALE